jgi:hypothetical protein
MKKNIIIVFVVVAVVASACARQKKVAAKKPAAKPVPEVTYLKMRRTACFGRCAEYSIEIFNTGLSRYTGIRFVTDSGVYEKNIGTSTAKSILNEFTAKRVDTLPDMYEVRIADLPGIDYTFKFGDSSKTIRFANFGPWYLNTYASHIVDTLLKSDYNTFKIDKSWKKVSSATKD